MLGNLPNRPDMPSDLNYTPTELELSYLEKSDFTCDSCSFKSKPTRSIPSGYMEVVKVGTNILSLCAPCASAVRLGRKVSGTSQHGLILWLPELTQPQVIHYARLCDTAMIKALPTQKQALKMINAISKHQVNRSIYPFYTSPGSIEQTIKAMQVNNAIVNPFKPRLFQGMRYLPTKSAYTHIYEHYFVVNPEYFSQPNVAA